MNTHSTYGCIRSEVVYTELGDLIAGRFETIGWVSLQSGDPHRTWHPCVHNKLWIPAQDCECTYHELHINYWFYDQSVGATGLQLHKQTYIGKGHTQPLTGSPINCRTVFYGMTGGQHANSYTGMSAVRTTCSVSHTYCSYTLRQYRKYKGLPPLHNILSGRISA